MDINTVEFMFMSFLYKPNVKILASFGDKSVKNDEKGWAQFLHELYSSKFVKAVSAAWII